MIQDISEKTAPKAGQESNEGFRKGPGTYLKSARERLGITIEDAAMHLRLTTQAINDLENNEYARFSALVFVRGNLRSYAKFLQVSPDLIIEKFNALGIEEPNATAYSPIAFKPHREITDQLVPWFFGLGGIILIALGFGWWFAQHHGVSVQPPEPIPSQTTKIIPISPQSAQDHTRTMKMKGEPDPLQPAKSQPQVIQTLSNTPVDSNAVQTPAVVPPQMPLPKPASSNNINNQANTNNLASTQSNPPAVDPAHQQAVQIDAPHEQPINVQASRMKDGRAAREGDADGDFDENHAGDNNAATAALANPGDQQGASPTQHNTEVSMPGSAQQNSSQPKNDSGNKQSQGTSPVLDSPF